MDNPAGYAAKLLSTFKDRAKFEHAPIELLHGNFLKCPEVKHAISSAGLVFMNNPKFGAELNLQVLGESLSLITLFLCVLEF
jgi:hypothetical protein